MEQNFYPKRCTSSSLAETVANIDELLSEVLVRVPARPLLRFKCVSKHWLSLISDPKFCHRHTLQNPHSSISAVFAHDFSFIPLDLDHDRSSNPGNQNLSDSAGSDSPNRNPLNFGQHLRDIMIIQSCNGLFLCRPIKTSNTTIYILNPTTKQFSTLAIPAAAAAASGQPCVLFGYALAFDPSKSPHHKVLFLQEGNHILNYHVHIYSSETRSWRLLSSCFVRLPLVDYDQAVYCNGAVHWVGLDNEISYYHIDDERVRNVFYPPPPPKKRELRMFRYFQESHCGSHLHLIDIYVTHLTRFEVLEMGRDYSGWSLKYHVDLDPQLTGFPWLGWCQFTVLLLVPEEAGEESSSLLLHRPGKVISYNFKSNIFKSFELTSSPGVDDSRRLVYNQSHRYMATLACV